MDQEKAAEEGGRKEKEEEKEEEEEETATASEGKTDHAQALEFLQTATAMGDREVIYILYLCMYEHMLY